LPLFLFFSFAHGPRPRIHNPSLIQLEPLETFTNILK
jgi:hypothetical protein